MLPSRRQKRKRVVLTLKQKMEICKRLEEGEKRDVLMQEFNIGSTTLHDIKCKSGEFEEFLVNSGGNKLVERRCTLRPPSIPIKETPTPGKQRKRVVLTLKQKMEICKRLEEGESPNVLMKEFNIGKTTIHDIKLKREEFNEFLMKSASERSIERRRTLKSAQLKDLDCALYEWFTVQRANGTEITGPMIVEKGKELHEEMKITQPCLFSLGWLAGFKIRHGIRTFYSSGGKKPSNRETAKDFCEIFNKLMVELDLTAEQIYNANEISSTWRCFPSTFVCAGDEICDAAKQKEDLITVMDCANVAGTHKVKLTVNGKPESASIPLSIDNESSEENDWMDSDIFTWWFHHVFVPSVKDNLRKKEMLEDSNVVLLWDNCHAYPPEEELVNGNIFVCYLPPNVTGLAPAVKSDGNAEREERMSWQTAAEAFASVLKFVEQRNCFTAQTVNQFQLLHSQFLHERRKAFSQADLKNLLRPKSPLPLSVDLAAEMKTCDETVLGS